MEFVAPPRAGARAAWSAAWIAALPVAVVLLFSLASAGAARAETAQSAMAGAGRADTPALGSSSAAAPSPHTTPAPRPAWETEEPKYRGGFALGLSLGVGVGSIAGYPNDVTEIGYAQYYTATGARPAGMASLWLGGALTDWFTVGIGAQAGRLFAKSGERASSEGLLFHVEAFPLFSLGGSWRDVGMMVDAGLGKAGVSIAGAPAGTAPLVDGGSASIIGGGVFWEAVRFWRFRAGPFVSGDYYWSDSVRRPAMFFGWRTALYTGP